MTIEVPAMNKNPANSETECQIRLWVGDAVDFYANECLGLSEWGLTVRIEYAIQDDATILGLCSQHPTINHATLTFRGDIKDDVNGHNTIIHELLHVKHSRIDNFLEDVVFESMKSKLANAMNITYRNVVYEPFIYDLASCLAPILYAQWCAYQDSAEPEPEPVTPAPAKKGKRNAVSE